MLGAQKDVGVSEDGRSKFLWTTELSRQRQLLSTRQIISKHSWKKPFFLKHLLDICSKRDRQKVNIDITDLARCSLTESMCHEIS